MRPGMSWQEGGRAGGGTRKNRRPNLWRSEDGIGAVEFGFIAPILMLLLLGIVDFGMAYWKQMQIRNAANAGIQWAMTNGYDLIKIPAVAASATNLSGIAVTPSLPCGCATGTGVTILACASLCPDNTVPKPYIMVNARICYTPLFTWPALPYCASANGDCAGCGTDQIALSAESVLLQ